MSYTCVVHLSDKGLLWRDLLRSGMSPSQGFKSFAAFTVSFYIPFCVYVRVRACLCAGVRNVYCVCVCVCACVSHRNVGDAGDRHGRRRPHLRQQRPIGVQHSAGTALLLGGATDRWGRTQITLRCVCLSVCLSVCRSVCFPICLTHRKTEVVWEIRRRDLISDPEVGQRNFWVGGCAAPGPETAKCDRKRYAVFPVFIQRDILVSPAPGNTIGRNTFEVKQNETQI